VLKWVKSANSPSFVALAFLNGLQYRTFDFKRFICDDLDTSCKHLMNFSPVTYEFKRAKGVRPLVDKQFGYAVPLLDLAGISTAFFGATATQFSFTYTLEGVTAMPRGLHARLCHAFLVLNILLYSREFIYLGRKRDDSLSFATMFKMTSL